MELDQFVCHNENDEVLLPPMKCKVIGIHNSDKEKCKGIVELKYMEQLEIENKEILQSPPIV